MYSLNIINEDLPRGGGGNLAHFLGNYLFEELGISYMHQEIQNSRINAKGLSTDARYPHVPCKTDTSTNK
jgi:hypothetical protein